MKKPTQEPVCSMFGDPCRFLSVEHAWRLCTFIKREAYHYVPVRQGCVMNTIGQMCNNQCAWINEMHYCPVRWLKANPPVLVKKHAGRPKGSKNRVRTVRRKGF